VVAKNWGKSDIGRWIDAELAIPGRRRVLSMLGLEGREYIVHPSLKVSRSFIDFFVVVMACCSSSSSVYSSAVVVFLITCYTLCFILILNDA
jgi:hypothetical protein